MGFLSQISTVQKVSENQNSNLQDYQQAQANLAALEHSSETDLATLAEKEKQLKSLNDASDKKLAEAKKVLAKLSAAQRQRLSESRREGGSRPMRGPELQRKPHEDQPPRSHEITGSNAESERQKAPPSALSEGTGSSKGAKALAYAKAQLGEPYARNAPGRAPGTARA